MKSAGELVQEFLNVYIDGELIKKTQNYSSLSSAWSQITEKNKIAAAADHSRLKSLERNVILVEADHPGWVQILQTKQRQILRDIQRRFPELAVTGISFMLSRGPINEEGAAEAVPAGRLPREPAAPEPGETLSPDPPAQKADDKTQEKEFKTALERFRKKLAARGKTQVK
jgi:hypothetical protein